MAGHVGLTGVLKEELQVDGVRVSATLTDNGLLRWFGASTGTVDVPNDVLSFSRGSFSITLLTFQLIKERGCIGGQSRRVRKDIQLEFDSNGSHNLWLNAFQHCLERSGRPKRLLVLVNPFGGKCMGKKVYFEVVEPLLKVAGITITMRETQFQRHAKDLAKSFDLSQFDGIVCVSGDGVLTEVLNGLLERADWERAVQMPLGIIPAGTGNGMAKSLMELENEPLDAASATFLVIKGHKQSLDVATVVQGQVKFHSLLMLSWGFPSDVDIESERFRYLGGLRLDVQALVRIVWLRRYNGRLAYIPAPGYEHTGDPYSGQEEDCLLENKRGENDYERPWRKNGYSGPLASPQNSEWRFMDGPFISVWLLNVPWAGEDTQPAPKAKFADGYLDLVVVRQCPRWSLLKMLLNVKDGSYINSKYVDYVKVKAFRIAPGGIDGEKLQGGYIDIDGEVLARGQGSFGDGSNDPMLYGPTIEMTVERGLATIYGPSGQTAYDDL